MIDHASVAAWLDRYVQAWKSYDPGAIGALFAENATYLYNPFDAEPLRGREAIVADWLVNPDAPDTYDAHYRPIAVEGNTAVTQGRSTYYEADGKTVSRVFDNIFVIRFDDSGQCIDFREWFMASPG